LNKYLSIFLILVSTAAAQDTNKVIIDKESGKNILIGYCTREAFEDTNFSWWFNSEYEIYKPDSASLNQLQPLLEKIEISAIIGTWCSDSRREFPRFLKILDQTGFHQENLTIIAVNEDKKIPGSNIPEKYDLQLVPTFIFYRDGSELGRIQESPEETLEKDIVKILQTQE
jgi:thiol-disulfide isomerase/thioredoxin